ncbi:MAG TPA: hypothetical protein VF120_05645 [Ktedonobacterales bacterium]
MAEPIAEPLNELIEMLRALPEDLQREAAERIRPIVVEFDERYWDRQFADPRSDAFFAQMAAECERAERDGELLPAPPYDPEPNA